MMPSMATLRLSEGVDGDGVIAQYLVTKITFWGVCRRLLTVTPSHLALFNPDDFACTNQWCLTTISDIEIAPDPDQFVLVFEKIRFRSSRVRVHCPARSHLVALLYKLRRQYSFEPLRVNEYDADSRRQHYQCSEHYADDSYDYFLLQVGLSGVTLLDEHWRSVAYFPFINIQRVARSTAHPDGLVISTMFQERLFLCHPRIDCIQHIVAAAQALGVQLTVDSSPLNMQLLRLRNSQALDNPAVVCFEVIKSVDDGKIEQHIQLIFQGVAMVEVHRKLRTVITRPYSTLLAVVQSDWDADTVVLQFVQDESLVVRVEARDQFIAILLLVCREAGNEQVELSPTTIKTNRLYHPHMSDNVRETAGTSLESFFLRRLMQVLSGGPPGNPSTRASPLRAVGWATEEPKRKPSRRRDKGTRLQQHKRRGMRTNAVLMEARLSVDTGISLNDHTSLTVVMEELNANVPLGGFSNECSRQLVNKAIETLVEHLATLVTSLRAYDSSSTADIITTLQCLTRLAESRHALIPEDLIPRFFGALYELVTRQHFLTCYWVLKLLQRYFEPRKSAEARKHRSKALQIFVENRSLLFAVLDLIPAVSSLSTNSSGRWMRPGTETLGFSNDDDSDAHLEPSLDGTLLFTKEERLEKDMNILTYEALFTLHHVLIFLQAKERQEVDSVAASVARTRLLTELQQGDTKKTDWASTIDFADSEHDIALHQENASLAALAKREIGEKLLGKYKFIMDSVVDVRFTRSCQTIVALINFLVAYFSQESAATENQKPPKKTAVPPGGFVLYDDERADPSGTVLYQVGSETEYRRKRQSMPLRHSALDELERETSTEEEEAKAQDRMLDELFAFLECYQADVATLDDRSRLFPEQHTILLPLLGFSQATSTDSSGNSVFYVSGMRQEIARLQLRDEDFLMLDHLEFSDDDAEEHRRDQAARRRGKIQRAAKPGPVAPLRTQMYPPQRADSLDTARREVRRVESSTSTEPFSIVDSRAETASTFVPRFMLASNFRRLDDARGESAALNAIRQREQRQQELDRQQQQHQQQERQRARGEARSEPALGRQAGGALKQADRVAGPRDRKPRPVSVAINDRISAHTCDACIACNDVCDNETCFFCAEKEYQLQIAFSKSTSLPRPRTTSTISSSLNSERKYSSCEVRRHQTERSCWVVIFGVVYDVTDLLSSHPGGTSVLLNAARSGKDCGELFVKKHPARARRVLENYYLGEFYHCENRTVLY